jgi:hypothetical protein
VSAHAKHAAGLEIDNENAQMKEGLADAKRGKQRSENTAGGGAGGLFGPDFMAKLVRNAEKRFVLPAQVQWAGCFAFPICAQM